jgi:hypothetical protein
VRIEIKEIGSLHTNEIVRRRWLATGDVNIDLLHGSYGLTQLFRWTAAFVKRTLMLPNKQELFCPTLGEFPLI